MKKIPRSRMTFRRSHYVVTMGQAFRDSIHRYVALACGRVTSVPKFTDESSTEICVSVSFVGSAALLQKRLWQVCPGPSINVSLKGTR